MQVGKPCLILQPCLLHCGRVKLFYERKDINSGFVSLKCSPESRCNALVSTPDSPRKVLNTECIRFPSMKWKNYFQFWNRNCLELLPISYERLSFLVILAFRSDEVITLSYDLRFIHCHSVQVPILTFVGGECCGLQFTQRETDLDVTVTKLPS